MNRQGERILENDITFRPFVAADYPILSELYDQCFPMVYPKKWYMRSLSPGNYSVLCFYQGKLVGAATGRRQKPKMLDHIFSLFCGSSGPSHGIGYISSIAVHPEHRRHGIGSLVLQNICTQLVTWGSCERLELHVQSKNTQAISFYTSHGFDVEKLIEYHYLLSGVEDVHALLMAMDVQRSEKYSQLLPDLTL